ncbi:MAG TPA: hypothetical protein VKE41_12255 [Roseiflexaceae bacterium]|nr:hypothetical protein [Roseiflexaceae bacterium]
MRVQTYTIWVHRHEPPRDNWASAQPQDDLTDFIDGMIAQMTYCPSFVTNISPDSNGLLVAGTQQVIQIDEQQDGMVALRTKGRNLWVTHAAYRRLLA